MVSKIGIHPSYLARSPSHRLSHYVSSPSLTLIPTRYHVRAIVVAGIGFFTDSYDIYAINLITATLGMVYWQGPPIPGSNSGGNYGTLPTNVNTAIKAATAGGAVAGQLGFGWLADVLGRRRMYGVELAIIILSTLAQSLAAPSEAVTMTGLLLFWRVVMGIGIGGDYPLSAVITSEYVPFLLLQINGAAEKWEPGRKYGGIYHHLQLLRRYERSTDLCQVRTYTVAWCHDGRRVLHARSRAICCRISSSYHHSWLQRVIHQHIKSLFKLQRSLPTRG